MKGVTYKAKQKDKSCRKEVEPLFGTSGDGVQYIKNIEHNIRVVLF